MKIKNKHLLAALTLLLVLCAIMAGCDGGEVETTAPEVDDETEPADAPEETTGPAEETSTPENE